MQEWSRPFWKKNLSNCCRKRRRVRGSWGKCWQKGEWKGGPLDPELFPHQGLRHGVRLILRKGGPELEGERQVFPVF